MCFFPSLLECNINMNYLNIIDDSVNIDNLLKNQHFRMSIFPTTPSALFFDLLLQRYLYAFITVTILLRTLLDVFQK